MKVKPCDGASKAVQASGPKRSKADLEFEKLTKKAVALDENATDIEFESAIKHKLVRDMASEVDIKRDKPMDEILTLLRVTFEDEGPFPEDDNEFIDYLCNISLKGASEAFGLDYDPKLPIKDTFLRLAKEGIKQRRMQ